ncbi:MAG: nitroreductase family protein [Gammaproteobacteria bacterium]|nr:nitroreductase family protein [Gammaproteobacteria bacterium]MDE0272616.1 nitroreductase family protein [Gammaproteobacteria bacterium]
MELFEVMRTAFAARNFTDKPVSDQTLRKLLDNARFAPSGGNRQGWKVIAVREAATRARLAALIEPTFKRYMAQMLAGEAPYNTVNPSQVTDADIEAVKLPEGIISQVTQAPVVLLVFVDLSVVASFDRDLDRVGVISGGSIYPFVWNILLAARNEGLGGTLTTFVGAQEEALKNLLGVPRQMAFAAMLPIGEPVKQLTRLKRKPVDEFAMRERWDGPPLDA